MTSAWIACVLRQLTVRSNGRYSSGTFTVTSYTRWLPSMNSQIDPFSSSRSVHVSAASQSERRSLGLVDEDVVVLSAEDPDRLGEGQGVHEEQPPVPPPVELGDLARQRVAVIDRPTERVGHPLTPTTGGEPIELPVPTLDPSALDLEADDPSLGVTQDEVTLVVPCALGVVAVDHARRVKDRPFVGELVTQRLEDLALGVALEVLVEKRAGKRTGHGGAWSHWRDELHSPRGSAARWARSTVA